LLAKSATDYNNVVRRSTLMHADKDTVSAVYPQPTGLIGVHLRSSADPKQLLLIADGAGGKALSLLAFSRSVIECLQSGRYGQTGQ
jgi:hypothetical protein